MSHASLLIASIRLRSVVDPCEFIGENSLDHYTESNITDDLSQC